MQVRRQGCRISSKPLVVFVPKYESVQIREWSWGGRSPFPDLRAHDPLCACRCGLCFSVEVPLDVKFWQGRPQPLVDVVAHELNRTYDTSRAACFIWRHTYSIAFRSGQPGGRNCSSTQSKRPISSLTNFDLCCGAPSVIIRIFPNLSHAAFRDSTDSFPVKELYLWKNPSPSSVIRPNTMVLECDPVYV